MKNEEQKKGFSSFFIPHSSFFIRNYACAVLVRAALRAARTNPACPLVRTAFIAAAWRLAGPFVCAAF
jgi:hypothetical protein